MPFYKTTRTFTFLHRDKDISDLDMADILDECEDGDMVGEWSDPVTVKVPDSVIGEELAAMGSDETFFSDEVEDEEDLSDDDDESR